MTFALLRRTPDFGSASIGIHGYSTAQLKKNSFKIYTHPLPLKANTQFKMRPLFLRPSTLPKLLRHYSTSPPSPLINVLDIPAPHTGRIRILSLNRPAARNAISRQLLQELRANIDAVAAEYDSNGEEIPPAKRYGGAAGEDKVGATRVLILTSQVDGAFCAGADLKERAGFTADEYAFYPFNCI
jgi:methylglutaconyl-CoA hydratase